MDAPQPTAAQIAFRRACAYWKKKILEAGGTERMYYDCLHRHNLPTAAQWKGWPTMDVVVGQLQAEYGRLRSTGSAA